MVLVDTSVWIALYRGRTGEVGERVWQLAVSNRAAVCGQVWAEFLGGFRRETERREYEASLAAFPFLETRRAAFTRAAQYLARHPALGPGDAIIAATAIDSSRAIAGLWWHRRRRFGTDDRQGELCSHSGRERVPGR